MKPEHQVNVLRMHLVIEDYGVVDALEALPKDNLTLIALREDGILMCAWAKALAKDLTPPEKLPPGTEAAQVARLVELARVSDASVLKAQQTAPGAWATQKHGPKEKTLAEIIESLFGWINIVQQEMNREAKALAAKPTLPPETT